MGLVLDYAIIGIFFFFLVALAYFIILSFFGMTYSLLKYGSLDFIKRSAKFALKASLISSALNGITITAISLIVISNILKGGLGAFESMGGFGYPIGALAIAAIIAGKIVVYGAISTLLWLLAAFALYAYFASKMGVKKTAGAKKKAGGKIARN
ncbi:MAG: hypothetical protein AABX01_02465 [Candidatus Micrarchaeota archaeon]